MPVTSSQVTAHPAPITPMHPAPSKALTSHAPPEGVGVATQPIAACAGRVGSRPNGGLCRRRVRNGTSLAGACRPARTVVRRTQQGYYASTGVDELRATLATKVPKLAWCGANAGTPTFLARTSD